MGVLDLKISCILFIGPSVALFCGKYTGISAKIIVTAIANRINPRQQIAAIGKAALMLLVTISIVGTV
jgi:hypothetical protein